MLPGRAERQAGEHFNPNTYDAIKTIAVHRHWLGGNARAGSNRADAAGGAGDDRDDMIESLHDGSGVRGNGHNVRLNTC